MSKAPWVFAGVVLCSVALWAATQRSEQRQVRPLSAPATEQLERVERVLARMEALEARAASEQLRSRTAAQPPAPATPQSAPAPTPDEDPRAAQPAPVEPSDEQLEAELQAQTVLDRAITAGAFGDHDIKAFRKEFMRLTGPQQAELVRLATLAYNQGKLAFDPAKIPF